MTGADAGRLDPRTIHHLENRLAEDRGRRMDHLLIDPATSNCEDRYVRRMDQPKYDAVLREALARLSPPKRLFYSMAVIDGASVKALKRCFGIARDGLVYQRKSRLISEVKSTARTIAQQRGLLPQKTRSPDPKTGRVSWACTLATEDTNNDTGANSQPAVRVVRRRVHERGVR